MKLFFFLIAFCCCNKLFAQCTALGQNPSTAFPICGSKTFEQQNVPICGSTDLFVPGCSADNADYENKNPFWYKFTCFEAGTLGFTITPNDLGDDYDWQLYDVTGLNPDEVYTNRNIIVAGNWSGSFGTTGAMAGGVNRIQCASNPLNNEPRFAAMPNLIKGHDYILLISHFTDSQSGYSLSFNGGTAVITDPVEPHLLSASAPCDGTEVRIKLNKKMKCNSLSLDGSEFYINDIVNGTDTYIQALSAKAIQCDNNFDFDSVSVFFGISFPPNTYTIYLFNGIDNNTLKDNCDREIPSGETILFTVFPQFPTPFDSVTTPKCSPQSLELVFPKNLQCSSIDPTGGDFFITGPYPVNISAATITCVNGLTNKIILQLAAPMQVAGNFLVNLQIGNDGNTILDECGYQTPLPDNVAFTVKDTVNANFNFNINYGCDSNVVSYNHNAANEVNNWLWSFGVAPNNNSQTPVVNYKDFTNKQTKLIVSNGVCADTATQTIVFDNLLKADFDVTPVICPTNPAIFTNKTIGTIVDYTWAIGNGNTIKIPNPSPQTFVPLETADYFAIPQLIVTNNYGCSDTIKRQVQVVNTCFIAVPSAFTPNGDGLNDFLYPLKAYKSSNLTFIIFNRFGQKVFYSNSWLNKWDGRLKGLDQPPGTYVWTLDYLNTETGVRVTQKGTTILIR